MLDHVFTDAIGALRDALESARLERQALEERFHADVLLGDVTWATSYGMPGEGDPPRIRCDLTLEWPTWAQTSYRQWYLDGGATEPPEIVVELALRVQRLDTPPDPNLVLLALPVDAPCLGNVEMEVILHHNGDKVDLVLAGGFLFRHYLIAAVNAFRIKEKVLS